MTSTADAQLRNVTYPKSYSDIINKSNDLSTIIKRTISSSYYGFSKEQFAGLKSLLDKIVKEFLLHKEYNSSEKYISLAYYLRKICISE